MPLATGSSFASRHAPRLREPSRRRTADCSETFKSSDPHTRDDLITPTIAAFAHARFQIEFFASRRGRVRRRGGGPRGSVDSRRDGRAGRDARLGLGRAPRPQRRRRDAGRSVARRRVRIRRDGGRRPAGPPATRRCPAGSAGSGLGGRARRARCSRARTRARARAGARTRTTARGRTRRPRAARPRAARPRAATRSSAAPRTTRPRTPRRRPPPRRARRDASPRSNSAAGTRSRPSSVVSTAS